MIAMAIPGPLTRPFLSRPFDRGHQLRAANQDIAINAEAATIAETPGVNHVSNQRKDSL